MFDTRIQRAMSMFLALNLPSWAKRDDFDFDILNLHCWMVTFPVLPLTGFSFLNPFGLL